MKLTEFCQYKESFLISMKEEKNLSPHTIRAYASDLAQCIAYAEKIEAREEKSCLINTLIERYFAALRTKKIDVASIARKVSCLRSYERFIEQHTQAKLQLKLIRPRIQQKTLQMLSFDDILYLLEMLPHEKMITHFPSRDKAIFELLYATGIRCSELVAIRIKDVNFFEKTIHIQTSTAKDRYVLFGSACEKKLLQYINHERIAIKHPSEYLFLNYRHEPLTTRSIQRICNMFSNFLPHKRPITPHMLRHSFACHMLSRGADIATVQELLGHKTRISTEKYVISHTDI